jgi:Flp pilus assembly pilin Flp
MSADRRRTRRKKIMAIHPAKIKTFISDETGLTTAEYAVGTVAVAGLGGVLIKLLTSDAVRDVLWNLISGVLSRFFG